MKNVILSFLFLTFFLVPCLTFAQENNKVTPNDLKLILGDWTGTLTYIDYRTNEPYTMPANLNVQKGSNEYQINLFNIYPNEPKANDKDKIRLSKDEMQINKIAVTSRRELSNNQIEITLEYKGKDDNQNASIRNIYILDSLEFVIRKEVKFDETENWIKRSEFKYKKKIN